MSLFDEWLWYAGAQALAGWITILVLLPSLLEDLRKEAPDA